MLPGMTPAEKNIVKSLVAVAWADGNVEQVETSVIEGLLAGFDASEAEEQEILEYAKEKRTLSEDLPLDDLTVEDREILLANAALLTHADGEQTPDEKALLDKLIQMLEIGEEDAEGILDSVKDGALSLSSRALDEAE
jgi:tellurite resistance protein